MAPKLNLYIWPGACSLASHVLLREAGLDFEITNIYTKGATLPAKELQQINPKGKVPVLIYDDEVVTESPAIFTAIAQLAPEKQFLGQTPFEAVRAYEWFNWLSGTVHGEAYGAFLRPQRFVDGEALHGMVRDRAREKIHGHYRSIDEKLRGREWALGDAFTAVDVYLLVFYRWGAKFDFGMDETYPHYAALAKRVLERDAVKKTLEIEEALMN